jgi:hypothetical protein
VISSVYRKRTWTGRLRLFGIVRPSAGADERFRPRKAVIMLLSRRLPLPLIQPIRVSTNRHYRKPPLRRAATTFKGDHVGRGTVRKLVGHHERSQYHDEFLRRQEEQGGFALPDVKAVASMGRLYTGLILSGYYSEAITRNDVSELLGVRLKHMAKIESSVFGHTIRF